MNKQTTIMDRFRDTFPQAVEDFLYAHNIDVVEDEGEVYDNLKDTHDYIYQLQFQIEGADIAYGTFADPSDGGSGEASITAYLPTESVKTKANFDYPEDVIEWMVAFIKQELGF